MSIGSFVHSANGDESSGSGLSRDLITEFPWNKISLEQPTDPFSEPPKLAFSGESRYLTPLLVLENGKRQEELHQSDSSQSSFDPKGNTINPHYQKIQERIKAALKLLSFREQRVLVQFWSHHVIGKHQLLTTIDQPFGLGVIDEGLCSYRRDSEHNPFVVEKDNEEEDRSPPARVFRLGLPEWTSDLTNYLSTDFPQKECAIRCNLRGYLALPVFNSTTVLCVGVLELLMSSKYTSYTYEVQQVHNAMKTVDLTTPQALHCPTLNIQDGHKQKELDIIFSTLKAVCGIHNLPLAQTWALSPLSSFASHQQCLTKSCNSFDNRCLGKVCMSTTGLPFHIQDLKMWPFWKACRERHVDNSRGYVGTALLSRGSCFCGDVTKLSEEEYPLVYNAQMSRLTLCFAVFLHNVECNSDYVLEFFLQDSKCVPNVVQTLKQKFEAAYGFELGDTSAIKVVRPSTEVDYLSLNADPHSIQMFSTSTTMIQTEPLIIPQVVGPHMDPSLNIEPDTVSTSTSCMDDNFMFQMDSSYSDSISSMATTFDTSTDPGEVSIPIKQGRKRKIDSETVTRMVRVNVTFNESVKEFVFSTTGILSDLENEVAKRFKLEGEELKLKYTDDENELIWICCNIDLKLALDTAVSNNTINLICESVHAD